MIWCNGYMCHYSYNLSNFQCLHLFHSRARSLRYFHSWCGRAEKQLNNERNSHQNIRWEVWPVATLTQIDWPKMYFRRCFPLLPLFNSITPVVLLQKTFSRAICSAKQNLFWLHTLLFASLKKPMQVNYFHDILYFCFIYLIRNNWKFVTDINCAVLLLYIFFSYVFFFKFLCFFF